MLRQKYKIITIGFLLLFYFPVFAGSTIQISGKIKDGIYIAPERLFTVALPRPLSDSLIARYGIRDVYKDPGPMGVEFFPSHLDFTWYRVLIVPKSFPRRAYKRAKRPDELSDAKIRQIIIGVERRGAERRHRVKTQVIHSEALTHNDRVIDYVVVVQRGLTKVPGLTSFSPFDIYYGMYVFSTKNYTVMFSAKSVVKKPKMGKAFINRSFPRMQKTFESLKIIRLEETL